MGLCYCSYYTVISDGCIGWIALLSEIQQNSNKNAAIICHINKS